MALTRLSNREMVKLGTDLIAPRDKQRAAIDAIEPARALVPVIEAANEALIASQVPVDTAVAALTAELTTVDGRHDDLVRALDGRLEAEEYAATNPTVREKMARVRGRMFATGRAIIQASYMEEAGEVPLRAVRVQEDERRLLRKLKTYDGRTLDELYQELQATGASIGALEQRRQQLGAEGEVVVKNRAARFQWIRAINALASVLDAQFADPQPILGPIRVAEADADRRARPSDATTETDPTVTPVPASDDPTDPTGTT